MPEVSGDVGAAPGAHGMFIGCSDYPQCDHTEVIDKPDETAITCPQCGQGKLLQRKSRYGKVFIPAIVTRNASSPSMLNLSPVNAPIAIIRC